MDWNVLHHAAYNGQSKIVAQLLVKDLELIDGVTSIGFTALHLATQGGHEQVVKQLLEVRPSLLSQRSFDHTTAFHIAIVNGQDAILTQLLAAGPTLINIADRDGQSLLHCAVLNDHAHIVDLLLVAHPSIIDQVRAASAGQDAMVQRLLTAKPSLIGATDFRGRTALHLALKEGHEAIAEAMLEAKPGLAHAMDDDAETVLHFAVKAAGKLSQAFILRLWRMNLKSLLAVSRFGETAFELSITVADDPMEPNKSLVAQFQWKVSIDEIAKVVAKHGTPFVGDPSTARASRISMRRFLPVMQQQFQHALHEDELGVVLEYLGFGKSTPEPFSF